MKKRNERTSARIAKIAGKVLRRRFEFRATKRLSVRAEGGHSEFGVSWGDICSLAASALTQAPDKPKAKRRGR